MLHLWHSMNSLENLSTSVHKLVRLYATKQQNSDNTNRATKPFHSKMWKQLNENESHENKYNSTMVMRWIFERSIYGYYNINFLKRCLFLANNHCLYVSIISIMSQSEWNASITIIIKIHWNAHSQRKSKAMVNWSFDST